MSRYRPYLFLVIGYFIALWILHGASIGTWMNQLPGSGEDGAKNFYTLAYHVAHDSSLTHFQGMNYPWGEHVSYTDNQPLISWVLQALDFVFPIADHLQTTLPWLLILSFLIGAIFSFQILRRLGCEEWVAILGAILIVYLNPQWLRFSGHYSLAHGFIIPWYIWTLISPKPPREKLVFLIVIPFIAGLIHPYFLPMLAILGGGHYLLENWSKRSLLNLLNLGRLALIVLGPIILFQLFMSLTDPIGDRSTTPFGYLVYRATLSSVFLPVSLVHGDFLQDIIPNWFRQSEEGGFYVGIAAIVVLISATASLILKRRVTWSELGPKQLLLLASLPLLLLALGLPFIIPGQSYLLDFAGPLKQFRGIGRFAFVFFFGANLFAMAVLNKWIGSGSRLKKIAGIASLILFLGETVAYSNYIADHTSSGTSRFHDRQVPDFIDPSEFQAILPFPYYHIGSENFRTLHDPGIVIPSMDLSLATGLPLMSVQMSRTSYLQTKMSLQLVNQLTEQPIILDSLNNKPLLLFVKDDAPLKASEMLIVSGSQPIGSSQFFSYYKTEVSVFNELIEEHKKRIEEDSLAIYLAEDKVLIDTMSVFVNSFDRDTIIDGIENKFHELIVDRKDWTQLVPKAYVWQNIEPTLISFWLDVENQNVVNTQVWLESEVNGSMQLRLSEVCDHLQSLRGHLALIEIEVPTEFCNPTTSLKLHRDGSSVELRIDELMIRPKSLNVKRAGVLNMNNYYYSAEEQ